MSGCTKWLFVGRRCQDDIFFYLRVVDVRMYKIVT